MAIKKSFGGASILKPGAYSVSKVDNSAGANIASNDTLFILGEAAYGAPGSSEGLQVFDASQVNALVAKYGSGPLVDSALAATRPSKTPGIGGAGRIYVWKTNASTQASLSVNEFSDVSPLFVFKDRKWGVDGNNISISIANGTNSATQKSFVINKIDESSELLGQNPGVAVMSIQYTGDASTAVMDISSVPYSLEIALAGDQTDGSLDLSINLNNYSIKQLVDFINLQNGYSCILLDSSKAGKAAIELDPLSSVNAKSAAVNMYRFQYEMLEIINNNSSLVEVELASTRQPGLPVNISNSFLAGGALGASSNSDFSTGFSKSLAIEYNVALPCISADASDDISEGLTDPASAYTISSVLAAMDTHLRLRGSVKNRKEAQGMGGYRASTKAAAFSAIAGLSSELVQIAMQDVRVLDVNGNLSWKYPHIFAALAAGIRLGTAVGEPLTHKFINANDFGHYVNASTGIAAGDFNEAVDVDQAIDAGVLFAERASGGIRIVVDNTTYGADDSFIFNRGSVIEAAQFVAKTLRETAELIFIGRKVSNGAASSIKNILRNKLIELNAPEVNIITASDDAPKGFVEETFSVVVTGNTALVQVEIKPVQGLDFIFIEFTIGDISQSA